MTGRQTQSPSKMVPSFPSTVQATLGSPQTPPSHNSTTQNQRGNPGQPWNPSKAVTCYRWSASAHQYAYNSRGQTSQPPLPQACITHPSFCISHGGAKLHLGWELAHLISVPAAVVTWVNCKLRQEPAYPISPQVAFMVSPWKQLGWVPVLLISRLKTVVVQP